MTAAYEQGYEAFFNEAEVGDNPYKMTQIEFTDWEDGYYAAMNDEYFKYAEGVSDET